MNQLTFEKASYAHKEQILKWLEEPHVREFWDNSAEHRADILIFMGGRKEKTAYYHGIFTYWVGLFEGEAFSLIMTSDVIDDQDTNDAWRRHLSPNRQTCSLDYMIGNPKFLGKGLASKTLAEFVKFYYSVTSGAFDTFFIDPNLNNPKARHVYEKAGFEVKEEFFRGSEWFALMVKVLGKEASLTAE